MTALDNFRLDGRHALVTGGGGLLGPVFAEALLEAGARVTLLDVDPRGLAAAAARLTPRFAERLKTSRCDLTKAADVRRAVAAAEAWSPLEVLVNAAAMNPKTDGGRGSRGMASAFASYPEALWRASLDVNLTGLFLATQAVCRGFEKRGRGVVVNVASTYGLVGPDQRLYREPGKPPSFKPGDYSTTKAGVLGFTRYLAAYYAGRGIRVNCLTPGGVYNAHSRRFAKAYASRTLIGRMARAEEYKGSIVFLASEASAYMTGANLVVDGGWTAI